MTKILIAVLLLFVATALLPLPAQALLQKGNPLPEITGETIDGEQFALSRLKGTPFILKIGTTWCGTCAMQSKAIDGLQDFLNENQIQFVEIFVQESAKKVHKYFNKKGYQLPDTIILDNGKITNQLNVFGIPRVILVDKNHQVYRDGETISQRNLKKKLEQMLSAD